MTYRVLAQKLRGLGCEFVRQAAGSHEIWWNPANKKFATVVKGKGDIPKGTLSAILGELGLTAKDLSK